MTENIEWGACPVCGGRVAGEVDSWECNGRLHVEQSYDNPPTCENGCPLEGFAPRIDLVAECGDGESDKETAERAVKKEWSRMCGIATRVDPCVCGGTPVLKPEECRLECPDCGRMASPTPSLVQAIAAWNDRMAGLRKWDAERGDILRLAGAFGLNEAPGPRALPKDGPADYGDGELLRIQDENGRYRERVVRRPAADDAHAGLFDLTDANVHRWVLTDGTVVTSPDGWTEPEHGEVSQTIRTLTGHHLVIPNSAVLYVAD